MKTLWAFVLVLGVLASSVQALTLQDDTYVKSVQAEARQKIIRQYQEELQVAKTDEERKAVQAKYDGILNQTNSWADENKPAKLRVKEAEGYIESLDETLKNPHTSKGERSPTMWDSPNLTDKARVDMVKDYTDGVVFDKDNQPKPSWEKQAPVAPPLDYWKAGSTTE